MDETVILWGSSNEIVCRRDTKEIILLPFPFNTSA
jgi:hypothetical protein